MGFLSVVDRINVVLNKDVMSNNNVMMSRTEVANLFNEWAQIKTKMFWWAKS
jgi:hypothetical protein